MDLRMDSGQRLYVFGLMSAKTGMAFQARIAAALAVIVQGLTITSSPGEIPIAPTAATSPEVHELKEMACLVSNRLAHSSSNFLTVTRKTDRSRTEETRQLPDSRIRLLSSPPIRFEGVKDSVIIGPPRRARGLEMLLMDNQKSECNLS